MEKNQLKLPAIGSRQPSRQRKKGGLKHEAALVVQKVWRGYQVRKSMEDKRTERQREIMGELFLLAETEQEIKALWQEANEKKSGTLFEKHKVLKAELEKNKSTLQAELQSLKQAKAKRQAKLKEREKAAQREVEKERQRASSVPPPPRPISYVAVTATSTPPLPSVSHLGSRQAQLLNKRAEMIGGGGGGSSSSLNFKRPTAASPPPDELGRGCGSGLRDRSAGSLECGVADLSKPRGLIRLDARREDERRESSKKEVEEEDSGAGEDDADDEKSNAGSYSYVNPKFLPKVDSGGNQGSKKKRKAKAALPKVVSKKLPTFKSGDFRAPDVLKMEPENLWNQQVNIREWIRMARHVYSE